MINLEAIFGLRRPDGKKLVENGFEKLESSKGINSFVKKVPVLDNQFFLEITVDVGAADGGNGAGIDSDFPSEMSCAVDYRVIERETGEEYQLVKIPWAVGTFLGSIQSACDAVLRDVARTCFESKIYHSSQTKAIIGHVKDVYDVTPEFLWKQYPTYGVLRVPENQKWFGVIMTLEREKLEKSTENETKSQMVEVVVLKGHPEEILQRVDGKAFFPGFHMNKKHWYMVVLDNTLSDQELWQLIENSYQLVR